MDVFGNALTDHFNNNVADILWLHNSYGEKEEMPVEIFFRTEEEMTYLELFALAQCKGKILDIGAGAGSHSFLLQNKFDTTALEISSIACFIMKSRGIKKILNTDIFNYKQSGYDTLLFMMNGIGLTGTIDKLDHLLDQCSLLLNKKGQILFDSSDISYLYTDHTPQKNKYFGQVSYRYEYKNQLSEWFNWLYIDKIKLKEIAEKAGWKFDLLFEDDHDQYLGRLTRKLVHFR